MIVRRCHRVGVETFVLRRAGLPAQIPGHARGREAAPLGGVGSEHRAGLLEDLPQAVRGGVSEDESVGGSGGDVSGRSNTLDFLYCRGSVKTGMISVLRSGKILTVAGFTDGHTSGQYVVDRLSRILLPSTKVWET